MYGIDAPRIYVLLIFSLICSSCFGIYLIRKPFFSSLYLNIILTGLAFLIAIQNIRIIAWMLYSSLFQKQKVALQMIDLLEKMNGKTYWQGINNILDVGCGRGLLMNNIAKKMLAEGQKDFKISGIDIFSTKDLLNNSEKNTLETIKKEGIPMDFMEIKNCDAREIIYDNNYFDLIVSSLTIHNVGRTEKTEQKQREEREKALNEIIRVTKPGGSIMIWELFHAEEIEKFLRSKGLNARKLKEFKSYSFKSAIIYAKK